MKKSKLKLKKETVRALSEVRLGRIQGGEPSSDNAGNTCPAPLVATAAGVSGCTNG